MLKCSSLSLRIQGGCLGKMVLFIAVKIYLRQTYSKKSHFSLLGLTFDATITQNSVYQTNRSEMITFKKKLKFSLFENQSELKI